MQILELLVTSCLLLSRAWSRQADVMCEGGHAEGDKWFDGCRWCVCQSTGPLCSPSQCSEFLTQIPRCSKIGSRWGDGCYHCHCHSQGIDCKADRLCVLLMRREGYGTDFLSRGACVIPEDDRCICGIDGVPSCTTHVIDRNASPAITIQLKPTARSPGSLARRRVTSSPRYYDFKPPGVKRDLRSNRLERSSDSRDHDFDYMYYSSKRDERHPQRRRSPRKHRFIQRPIKSGPRHLERPRRLQRREFESPAYMDRYWADAAGSNVRAPPNLLVVSTNRCRWGVRWYGGGLRCFCGPNHSITCGDPSFVASRIDGFKLEKFPCEDGHVWEDIEACRICECHFSGVVLCRRSPACPLPFLIKPLSLDPSANDNPGTSGLDSRTRGEDSDGRTDEFTFGPGIRDIDWDKTGDGGTSQREAEKKTSKGDGENVDAGDPSEPDTRTGDTDGNRKDTGMATEYERPQTPGGVDLGNIDSKHNRLTSNTENEDENNDGKEKTDQKVDSVALVDENNDYKRTTVVVVKECKPMSRWRDGCKFCKCDKYGQKDCDDSNCPKARPVTYEDQNHSHIYIGMSLGRPVQRPPKILETNYARTNPVSILLPNEIGGQSCGSFRVGQKFWHKCNRCICTPHGPQCTAKNCG